MASKRVLFLLPWLLAGALALSSPTGATLAGPFLPSATPPSPPVRLNDGGASSAGDGHIPYDPATLRPGQPYPGAGYPWERVERAAPAGWGPPAPPEGVDLDVTFISRTPKYRSYCVAYSWDPPGQPGIPSLCPGTEGEQRWPAAGEVVTFTAHVTNKGTQASPAFAYRWEIDGAEVAAGVLSGLPAGAATTTSVQWPWGHVMDGERVTDDHTVRFTADPTNAIVETYESNNSLEDRTNALGFRIAITPEMIQAYDTPWNPASSYSAEDWLQRQIVAMNWVFANSIYPTTPAGATERVRIDEIQVTATPPINDRSSDGGWFVDADYRIVSAWYDAATDIDWALVHELSHQVGVIDLYQLDMSVTSVHVLDRNGMPANFGFTWPRPDLMGGGDIAPHTDGHLYSSHGAAGFSSTKGYRRGYYGEYQFDIPAENWLLVLDNKGQPAAGVTVSLYQRNGPVVWPGDVTIDNVPEFEGATGADGRVRLANRQIIGGPWATATGHVLRDNPFGVVDVVGGRNRFLVKLAKGKHEEFAWLDITDFNLAYWRGDTASHTLTLASHVPAATVPAAPEGLVAQVAYGQVALRWQASFIPEVTGYYVYRARGPVYAYERISDLIQGASPDYITECHGGDCIYTVTAADLDGRESGFSDAAWAPDLVSPSAIVIAERGAAPTPVPVTVVSPETGLGTAYLPPSPLPTREGAAPISPLLAGEGPGVRSYRAILDTHAGPLIGQLPDERYLGRFGSVHFGLTGGRYLAIDPQGRFLVTDPNRHVVRVTDAKLQPLFEFGGHGTGPGQFQSPAGVTAWGPPCTVEGLLTDDPHTLLLLHFDGSYTGANGEIGVANGTSFATGRYGQGLQVDDSDTLTYETVGNLNRTQGAVEFWLQPAWNGDDQQNYTFFEVGQGWFNRMRITKDGANNLRFLIWDSVAEYGVDHNVGHWRAGEWHHIAVTWSGTDYALYLDGALRNRQPGPSPDSLASLVTIGSNAGGNFQAQAVLDEFRISDIPRVGNSDTCAHILVADSGNNRIQAFNADGSFVSAYGTSGSMPGQFNDPQGLAVDDRGRVIVVDRGNNRLQQLEFDGQVFSAPRIIEGSFNGPTGVWAYGSNYILVADTGNNAIQEVLDTGFTYYIWSPFILDPSPFNAPRGVAADREGNLIVADTGNRRIVTIPRALPTFTPAPPVTPTTMPTATPTPTPTATPTATPEGDLTLTGLAFDASSGPNAPIEGATVWATMCVPHTFTVEAGPDGRYSLLLPGPYLQACQVISLGAWAPGYAKVEIEAPVAALRAEPVRDFGLFPTGIAVNTTDDELNADGDCSLREAVEAANTDAAADACPAGRGADTIYLPEGVYRLALAGAGEDANAVGDLDILDDLILIGGATDATVIHGGQLDRVLHVQAGVTARLSGITITRGRTVDGRNSFLTPQDAEGGGGIFNAGVLTLDHCTVTGNRTGDGGRWIDRDFSGGPGGNGGSGGGIYNQGTLTAIRSQVTDNFTGSGGSGTTGTSGNTAVGQAGDGGGIYNAGAGDMWLDTTLVRGNSTADGSYLTNPVSTTGGPGGDGGGIFNAGSGKITNSTVAWNRAGAGHQAGTHGGGGAGGNGGGIFNAGRLTVSACTVNDNQAGRGGDGGYCGGGGDGGGSANGQDAALHVLNSTVSCNRSGDGGAALGSPACPSGNGGGVHSLGELKIDSSTFSGNDTGPGGSGGGIFVGSDDYGSLRNTILAGNTAALGGPECTGLIELKGHNLLQTTDGCILVIFPNAGPNLLGADPLLEARINYGGPTETHALGRGSPAIDAGACTDLDGNPIPADQRGVSRPRGVACDIGAYEEAWLAGVWLPLVLR